MRIAQIAPLFESVPPRLYGGTERIVSYLTEALVSDGHDVTLFASGDSVTAARLVSPCAEALRLASKETDQAAVHMLMLEQVMAEADQFDVLHFHWDYMHFPVVSRSQRPNLTTLHGRLDLPAWKSVTSHFASMPLVSISFSQRAQLPDANWLGTVYHGIRADCLAAGSGTGGYLAFVGRLAPEKGVDRAIEIAKRAGMPLKIAAKIAEDDRSYFKKVVRPLLDDPLIEYVGEVDERGKGEFLAAAAALLFPIDWPEPFGLVQIEAMACGTPVIAFRRGSVPEVVKEGVTGFVVENVDEAVEAVGRVAGFDRVACRVEFDASFSVGRMASDYTALYEQVIEREPIGRPRGWTAERRIVGSLSSAPASVGMVEPEIASGT